MSYKNSLTKIGIYSSEDILSSSLVLRLIPNLNSILILYNTRFFGFEQAPTKIITSEYSNNYVFLII